MNTSFFVSDLHGQEIRYQKLFRKIEEEKPEAVFLGGDLLPSGLFLHTKSKKQPEDFIKDFLVPGFLNLQSKLAHPYPQVFLILGNDDERSEETKFIKAKEKSIGRKLDFLIQEMLREANTIASKSADVLISKHIVEVKSELEKIKEQIQNIE